MSDVPVALRVKRRRDCAAVPAEIILETSSRPASAEDVLASTLQQTLAVSHNQHGFIAPPEGPAKKRCRYVLVSGPAAAAAPETDNQAAAGALKQQVPVKDGPILELWQTSGLRAAPAAAGSSGSISSQAAANTQHQPPGMPSMLEQHGGVYAAMLQDYMQEQQQQAQQQQQHVGTGIAGRQQQRPRRGPSKRAHHNSTPISSSTPLAAPQHQQQQQLPPYMTRGMLKHYGLWQSSDSQQQLGQQVQHGGVHTPGPADPQHSAQATAAAAATEDSMDADYTYDVYVAVPVDGGAGDGDSSSRGWGAEASMHTPAAAAAAARPSSSAQHGSAAVDDGSDLSGFEVSLELLVVQVWEDELLQLQLDWALAQDAAADDGESEDSNAEDYYANDYPDEDDCSLPDSSDAEDGEAHGRYNGHLDANDVIGFYQPGSSRKAGRGRGGARGESSRAGGYESSESFDCEDYVSSGDESCGDREEMGPAWMRKHCVGYGEADAGQTWRSVLAQQQQQLAPAGSRP